MTVVLKEDHSCRLADRCPFDTLMEAILMDKPIIPTIRKHAVYSDDAILVEIGLRLDALEDAVERLSVAVTAGPISAFSPPSMCHESDGPPTE